MGQGNAELSRNPKDNTVRVMLVLRKAVSAVFTKRPKVQIMCQWTTMQKKVNKNI